MMQSHDKGIHGKSFLLASKRVFVIHCMYEKYFLSAGYSTGSHSLQHASHEPASDPLKQDLIIKGNINTSNTINTSEMVFDKDVLPIRFHNSNASINVGFLQRDGTVDATMSSQITQFLSKPLKEAIELDFYRSDNPPCQNNLEVSNGVKGLHLRSISIGYRESRDNKNSTRYYNLFNIKNNKTEEYSYFLYVNANSTIGGSLTCPSTYTYIVSNKTVKNNYILQFKEPAKLKPGWNEIKLKLVITDQEVADTINRTTTYDVISITSNNVYHLPENK